MRKRRIKRTRCLTPRSWVLDEPLPSGEEECFVLIGQSVRGRLLVVVHAERGDRIRIISARLATNKERFRYEENEE
jgi:uncharacterized DUF497 family protein